MKLPPSQPPLAVAVEVTNQHVVGLLTPTSAALLLQLSAQVGALLAATNPPRAPAHPASAHPGGAQSAAPTAPADQGGQPSVFTAAAGGGGPDRAPDLAPGQHQEHAAQRSAQIMAALQSPMQGLADSSHVGAAKGGAVSGGAGQTCAQLSQHSAAMGLLGQQQQQQQDGVGSVAAGAVPEEERAGAAVHEAGGSCCKGRPGSTAAPTRATVLSKAADSTAPSAESAGEVVSPDLGRIERGSGGSCEDEPPHTIVVIDDFFTPPPPPALSTAPPPPPPQPSACPAPAQHAGGAPLWRLTRTHRRAGSPRSAADTACAASSPPLHDTQSSLQSPQGALLLPELPLPPGTCHEGASRRLRSSNSSSSRSASASEAEEHSSCAQPAQACGEAGTGGVGEDALLPQWAATGEDSDGWEVGGRAHACVRVYLLCVCV